MKRSIVLLAFCLLFSCRYEGDNSKLPEGKLVLLPRGIVAALEAAAGFCVLDLSDINNCNL